MNDEKISVLYRRMLHDRLMNLKLETASLNAVNEYINQLNDIFENSQSYDEFVDRVNKEMRGALQLCDWNDRMIQTKKIKTISMWVVVWSILSIVSIVAYIFLYLPQMGI